MIIERSESPQWLSNTYLVASAEGEDGFFVDAGGPVAPLIEAAQRLRVRPTHVLLTHRHHDHVAELNALTEAFPGIAVLVHPEERDGAPNATGDLVPGATLAIGRLSVESLHTPGHTAGMVSLLVDGTDVFTGDTLFKGSVGGVRAPGATSYTELKHSVMDVLLALPPQTRIHPGHTQPTTVADELATNGFARIWQGLDPEGAEPCTALGEPATLVHFGDDYDGGHKAWVRWPDGRDDIVGGSRVVRGGR